MTGYLLRTQEQIRDFKAIYGDNFDGVLDGIEKYLMGLPSGRWIDYTANITPGKIPSMVGMLCCWMIERSTDSFTIDFKHPQANYIKVRRYEFKTIKQDSGRDRNGQKAKA